MKNIFVLTTRGLETLSAAEVAALPGVTVTQISYRRIVATCAGPLASLLALRTVDDVFLNVATWSGIGRPRQVLSTLQAASANLNLHQEAAICSEIRPVPKSPTFSITANFVGKRNYTSEEIKMACAAGISDGHGWTYTPDDSLADLNVRIFIEHERAFVGVRLGQSPLHRRPYKQGHVLGSLKPTVAAALLNLVGLNAAIEPGLRLLDPCCGAGTILIEAAQLGLTVQGGDNDNLAITTAQANARLAGAAIDLHQWDAQTLPLANAAYDRVVSNLPWGRKVNATTALQPLYRHICREIERVLAPGGQVALLTNTPHLVSFHQLRCDEQIEISLFGQTPTIMIFSV